jgi:hypothetical protein
MASSIFRINLRKSFYLLVENKTLTKKKSQIVALTDAEIIWKLLLTGQSKSIGDMLTFENQRFSSSSSQYRHSRWSNYLN